MGVASDVTAVVEEEATIISLDKDSFERMQIDDPAITIAIQNSVIQSVAAARDRLSRELAAIEERDEDPDLDGVCTTLHTLRMLE